MIDISVRQALNEAMAEEMRRDDDVFLMGEEVGEYDGAYKVCLLYTSPSPRDLSTSRMPSSA